MTSKYLGQATNRVDGRAKVTGAARYAAEYNGPDMLYGVVLSSEIAAGRIEKIDPSAALAVPGVVRIFTHENGPALPRSDKSYSDEVAPPGSPFRPLANNRISFCGQPIGLVVAETFEQARYAVSLIRVKYRAASHKTELTKRLNEARPPEPREGITPPPPPRGQIDAALKSAAVQISSEYVVPFEHHNPMEPFATTVMREEDGRLTVYDKTQGVQNVQSYLCSIFGFKPEQLRVLSPFVGGAFGLGLRPQYQVFLAVLAARELKRSVRVSLTRQQMFTLGHRPHTWQRVVLAASSTGQLQAMEHEAIAETSQYEDYSEPVTNCSSVLYQCPNVRLSHKVVPLHLATPCDMRAPGPGWGMFALESAMDELAEKLGLDPIELRLRNYAATDQAEKLPFSSKELRECYRQGMKTFGWSQRNPQPRSMRKGDLLVGWGMASGIWEAMQREASAKARLTADGCLVVSSATADIGTGTYTIMSQLAADLLGLPLDRVTFKLGDSALAKSPVEGGSWTASTIGSAVHAACHQLRQQLFRLARKHSAFAKARYDEVRFVDGHIQLNRRAGSGIGLTHLLRDARQPALEVEVDSKPLDKQARYSRYAHTAVFAEVTVDEELGIVRVPRLLSAVAAGRILNPKTARSQIMGGMVWGLGMALEEESLLDHTFGKFMNPNLAEYHVPVNADVHELDVLFVKEEDQIVNPMGAKGIGEIGLVGAAAAIANALHHATGRRFRKLPITVEEIMADERKTQPTHRSATTQSRRSGMSPR